jgi:hypothetical protein
MLIGCGGGSMSAGGSGGSSSPSPESPSPVAEARCSTGGPEDISGQCRNSPPTMGALEAGGATGVASAAVASLSAPQLNSRPLEVTWQPIADNVSGYMVYFGKTADTANVLVSNLPTNAGLYNPSAPTVTYDSGRDLGLYAGDSACFRIFAYDSTNAISGQPTLVCTVV